jgi:hypothetical protein
VDPPAHNLFIYMNLCNLLHLFKSIGSMHDVCGFLLYLMSALSLFDHFLHSAILRSYGSSFGKSTSPLHIIQILILNLLISQLASRQFSSSLLMPAWSHAMVIGVDLR